MTSDLESRIRRLEDRALISERVIKYAIGVDRADWEMFADCFTDPVHADFSESGVPAADFARDDLVALVRVPLSGFTATQHLSPNHVIEFDENDPDRAICYSYMYAQHYLEGSEGGDFFLFRGSYTNHMRRTSDGWRIESLTQHASWSDGNQNALTEATARSQGKQTGA
ncbi:MAG: nuclear transport factor 2 family protein [Actinomycetota bacterium]|nr:nuclear transport factor 2 family protein [Actinomycetota bacterium]